MVNLATIEKSLSLGSSDDDTLIDIFVYGYDEDGRVAYNMAIVDDLCSKINQGMSLQNIADMFSVAGRSLMKFLEVHPPIMARLQMAKLEFQLKITGHLIDQSSEGNFAASKFLLLNRGSDWTDKHEEAREEETPVININYSSVS